MIQKILIILLLTMLNFTLSIRTTLGQEILPEIKATASVDDTVITLGDIFTNLNEKQDLVIGNAPEPGKKLLLSARYILKLTREHNVRWRNSAGVTNIVVSRDSTIVNYTDLKPILSAELKNLYHTDEQLDVRFYNRNGQIHLPNGYDVDDLTIRNISLDQKSDKFSALIGAPTGQGEETQHIVNGRTIKVTMVPSLVKTIRSGDIIKSSDVKWTPLPDSQIGRNIIRSKDKLVGMTPRNQIQEGTPIRLSEVDRPVLVKRGSLVKIHFNTARINLSTIGKAIENGGKGDVIQVKNNSSDKIISAIVLGPNQVQVNINSDTLVLLNQ